MIPTDPRTFTAVISGACFCRSRVVKVTCRKPCWRLYSSIAPMKAVASVACQLPRCYCTSMTQKQHIVLIRNSAAIIHGIIAIYYNILYIYLHIIYLYISILGAKGYMIIWVMTVMTLKGRSHISSWHSELEVPSIGQKSEWKNRNSHGTAVFMKSNIKI